MISTIPELSPPGRARGFSGWTGIALAVLGWLFAAWTIYASGNVARDTRVQDLQTRVTVLESQYQEVTRRLNEIDGKLDQLLDRHIEK